MENWQAQLNRGPLPWLLASEEPGARYLAMRDVLDLPPGDPDLLAAQALAHTHGPIAAILDQMDVAGFWVKAGPGYNPKYRSGVWSLVMLAQLGASAALDPRIERACAYLFEHALTPHGQFSIHGTPSGTVDCLQGNLCAAMLDLGYEHPSLEKAFEWMARSVTGEGVAPKEEAQAPLRYYAYKCGPGFLCGANDKLPCAWGAVKVMLAFGKLQSHKRTPLIERAIQAGIDFLLGVDPARADYPAWQTKKPSRNWWKFGFPVFYVTDLLQNVAALVSLGYGNDPRLAPALQLIRAKQDAEGRWALEYDYSGKTWIDFGPKKQPNKWVTTRALRVLKHF